MSSPSYIPYLVYNDYLPSIQKGQLSSQILDALQSGDAQRKFAESWSIGKIYTKLKSKYDLDYEITPTLPYNPTKKYYGNDRITIDFPDWIASKQYYQFNCVIKDGIGYCCLTSNNDATFTPSNWQQLGYKHDIYFAKLPYPLFQLNVSIAKGTYIAGYYNIGDKVFWNNRIYSCLQQTIIPSHITAIQFNTYSQLPSQNIFPNDPQNGVVYWKDEGEYSFLGKDYLPTYPLDEPVEGNEESKWEFGDNRDPLVVQSLVDMSLWRLHTRISPNNIPDLRQKLFDYSCIWLQKLKDGEEEAKMIMLQPQQGKSFRWGGKPKNHNGYT